MTHKIFLSHNYADKPLVEAVALKLAEIFGQDKVFYDSWSIKPGDGIIDAMNDGMTAPEVVFFFVSKNSLASGMVGLEWKNALYSAVKGDVRLVPVLVDGTEPPALLKQTRYIDMHSIGLEAAIREIVDIARGGAEYVPQHQRFSNLTHKKIVLADGSIEITISASHMLEPNPNFAFVFMNDESEVSWWIKDSPAIISHFWEGAFTTVQGALANAVVMKSPFDSLTPSNPHTFQLMKKGAGDLEVIAVLHDQGGNQWRNVP